MQDWWLAYWWVWKAVKKYAEHRFNIFLTDFFFSFCVCLIRADEQEKLSANSTIIQNGQNITRELDLDFYLGVYGGNLTTRIVIYSAQHVTCVVCAVVFQWCKGECSAGGFYRFDCSHHHFWLYQEFGPVQRAGEERAVSAQPHVQFHTQNTRALLWHQPYR